MKVLFSVKGYGDITAELYPQIAPATVKNFVGLVDSGFYDGLIFHRVIPGFMIQGGGFTADFKQKNAKSIKGEFAANGFKQNTLSHVRGVLSMARTAVPDSASSQFFIMHADAPHLDGQYAAFGRVVEGIEVVDKIAAVRTGNYGYFADVPTEPVVIECAKIIEE